MIREEHLYRGTIQIIIDANLIHNLDKFNRDYFLVAKRLYWQKLGSTNRLLEMFQLYLHLLEIIRTTNAIVKHRTNIEKSLNIWYFSLKIYIYL